MVLTQEENDFLTRVGPGQPADELLRREIEKVQRGEDPAGVIRDPNHEMIDTKLQESLQRFYQRGTGVVVSGQAAR